MNWRTRIPLAAITGIGASVALTMGYETMAIVLVAGISHIAGYLDGRADEEKQNRAHL